MQSASYDIYRIVERYLMTDGMAWLVGKLKTNIVRTVYRRKVSPVYTRTNAFRDSVRGRALDKGKQGMSYVLEIIAYPDPTDMNPSHTSWASGSEDWNGINVDQHLTNWLEKGHGGMGVHYKPARFIEKTEEEIDDPKGFYRGMLASLGKAGFRTGRDDGGGEF